MKLNKSQKNTLQLFEKGWYGSLSGIMCDFKNEGWIKKSGNRYVLTDLGKQILETPHYPIFYLSIPVKKIFIVRTLNDLIHLETDLSDPFPNKSKEYPSSSPLLRIEVRYGTGEEYCLLNFGRKPDEIIESSSSPAQWDAKK